MYGRKRHIDCQVTLKYPWSQCQCTLADTRKWLQRQRWVKEITGESKIVFFQHDVKSNWTIWQKRTRRYFQVLQWGDNNETYWEPR
jgi:hypothetical protein